VFNAEISTKVCLKTRILGKNCKNLLSVEARASAENFPWERGANGKIPKINKKYRKIALFASPRGEGGNRKGPKNSTFKPLSTIFVPCLKIQGEGHGLPLPKSPALLLPLAITTLYSLILTHNVFYCPSKKKK